MRFPSSPVPSAVVPFILLFAVAIGLFFFYPSTPTPTTQTPATPKVSATPAPTEKFAIPTFEQLTGDVVIRDAIYQTYSMLRDSNNAPQSQEELPLWLFFKATRNVRYAVYDALWRYNGWAFGGWNMGGTDPKASPDGNDLDDQLDNREVILKVAHRAISSGAALNTVYRLKADTIVKYLLERPELAEAVRDSIPKLLPYFGKDRKQLPKERGNSNGAFEDSQEVYLQEWVDRRYQEGGQTLLRVWSDILQDLAKRLEPKPDSASLNYKPDLSDVKFDYVGTLRSVKDHVLKDSPLVGVVAIRAEYVPRLIKIYGTKDVQVYHLTSPDMPDLIQKPDLALVLFYGGSRFGGDGHMTIAGCRPSADLPDTADNFWVVAYPNGPDQSPLVLGMRPNGELYRCFSGCDSQPIEGQVTLAPFKLANLP